MGNCLSGLAFKPEEDNDEPRYGEGRAETRANIQNVTSSRARAGCNNGNVTHSEEVEKALNVIFDAMTDDVFEPRTETSNQIQTSSRAKPGYIYRFGNSKDEDIEKRLKKLRETQTSSRENIGYTNGLVGHPDAEANAAFEKRIRELKKKNKPKFDTKDEEEKSSAQVRKKQPKKANKPQRIALLA